VEARTPPSLASLSIAGQQGCHRPRCAPRPHGDVGDLVGGEVERGDGDLLVFQHCSCRLVLVHTYLAGLGVIAFLWFLAPLHAFLSNGARSRGLAALSAVGGATTAILIPGVALTTGICLNAVHARDPTLVSAFADTTNVLTELSKFGLVVLILAVLAGGSGAVWRCSSSRPMVGDRDSVRCRECERARSRTGVLPTSPTTGTSLYRLVGGGRCGCWSPAPPLPVRTTLGSVLCSASSSGTGSATSNAIPRAASSALSMPSPTGRTSTGPSGSLLSSASWRCITALDAQPFRVAFIGSNGLGPSLGERLWPGFPLCGLACRCDRRSPGL